MTPRRRIVARRAVLALALGTIAAAAACGGGAQRPNVLVLVMDTTRADRCTVAGGAPGTTPSLDRLAATGVRYLDAWSPGGWTAPAHASLFTGLRPEHHGVDVGLRMFLDASIPTLAERLAAAGWSTACFTNNELVGPGLGLDRGFQRWEGLYLEPRRAYPWCDATHERALAWALDVDRAGGRFLLFVNDMEPHLPYTPPDDVARRFLPADATPDEVAEARAFDFPRTLAVMLGRETVSARMRTLLTALYDAEIATLDASIGRLLGSLDAAGVLDRTLVVVCSDHGENLGDHGLWEHRFSLHRSIRRVPLVVRLPGSFDGGRVVTDPVRLEDVMPTVLEACGLDVPARLDGASLAASLPGRVARASQGPPGEFLDRVREAVPGADPSRFAASWEAVFDGRFHYLESSDDREHLFDTVSDPGEASDLAQQDDATRGRMRTLLGDRSRK